MLTRIIGNVLFKRQQVKQIYYLRNITAEVNGNTKIKRIPLEKTFIWSVL